MEGVTGESIGKADERIHQKEGLHGRGEVEVIGRAGGQVAKSVRRRRKRK